MDTVQQPSLVLRHFANPGKRYTLIPLLRLGQRIWPWSGSSLNVLVLDPFFSLYLVIGVPWMRRVGTLSPSISQFPTSDDREGDAWGSGVFMANLVCNWADRRLIRVESECLPSESISLACLVSPFGVSCDVETRIQCCAARAEELS